MCRRQVSQLTAGSQDIPTATLSDEDVDTALSNDRLEGQHVTICRAAKWTAGKGVEGNQVHLAGNPSNQFDEAARVLDVIVLAGEEDVFECQSPARGQLIAAAGGHESLERSDTIYDRHQTRTL